jgi:hypothetical protein
VFALAPAVVVILALGLPTEPVTAGLAGGTGLLIAPVLLTKYVRDRGVALEKKLFAQWGAPPTTLLLQPSADGLDVLTAARRANVKSVTGLPLPDSGGMDSAAGYDAAVRSLRSKASAFVDSEKVHAENKGYGFERNVLAIRPEGLTIATLSLAALAAATLIEQAWGSPFSIKSLMIGDTFALALLGLWRWWPTEVRVRRAGDRYAERLLDAAAHVK